MLYLNGGSKVLHYSSGLLLQRVVLHVNISQWVQIFYKCNIHKTKKNNILLKQDLIHDW